MKNNATGRSIWMICFAVIGLAGCDSGRPGATSGSRLSSSDHAQVMELLKVIYKAGLGERIVAWYETEARSYFDHQSQKLVEFPTLIKTLSVAVPEFVTATQPVEQQLTTLASKTTLNGWRLTKFEVQVDFHGAGGGPSGNFDKITIYPLEVEKQ